MQTEQDIQIDWLSLDHKICLTAPYISNDPPLTSPIEWNCQISNLSDIGFFAAESYDPSLNTQCDGMIYMCKKEVCEDKKPYYIVRLDKGPINVNV